MGDSERYQVTGRARINAPAGRVYRILSDYRDGHPRILPPQFKNFVVEQGGLGAGTLTRFEMKAFGTTRAFRHEVIEPEPGRILVERDRDVDAKTTFLVEPAAANAADVTITTELVSRSGFFGVIERFLSRRYLSGVYKEELTRLDKLASGSHVPAGRRPEPPAEAPDGA
jgi:polyketide cyclase/dehydrase/lipid transport protein